MKVFCPTAGMHQRSERIERMGWVATMAMLMGTSVVHAETSPQLDPLGAQALFEQGKQLLKQGDWANACDKFHKSQVLEPAVSTLIKLAACREHEGRLATAWLTYQQAMTLNRENAESVRRKELDALVRKRADELLPRLPQLRIDVPEAPPGLDVKRDGTLVPLSALGEPLPVDPGLHEVTANAPGYAQETIQVDAAEGKLVAITLALEKLPIAEVPRAPALASERTVQPAPALASERTVQPPVQPPIPARPPAPRAALWHGVGLGGAGIVALGLAGYFGWRTRSSMQRMDQECSSDQCTKEAYSLHSSALRTQTAGYFFLGIGATLIGGGIVSVALLSSREQRTTGQALTLTLDGNTVSARGEF